MEYISKKFVLDRDNKIEIRMDEPMELPGNEWYCGLKEFSLEQKWSLANEKISILYQNGYVAHVQPKEYHAYSDIDKVMNEMFPQVRRMKRKAEEEAYDVVGRITGNQQDSEDEEEEKEEESKPKITAVGATKTSPVKETEKKDEKSNNETKTSELKTTTTGQADKSETTTIDNKKATPVNSTKVVNKSTEPATIDPKTTEPASNQSNKAVIGDPKTTQAETKSETKIAAPLINDPKTTQAEKSNVETKAKDSKTKATEIDKNQSKAAAPVTQSQKTETKTDPVPAKKQKTGGETYETEFRKEDPKGVGLKWKTQIGNVPEKVLRYEKMIGESFDAEKKEESTAQQLPEKSTAEKLTAESDEEDKGNTSIIIQPPGYDEAEEEEITDDGKTATTVPPKNPVTSEPKAEALLGPAALDKYRKESAANKLLQQGQYPIPTAPDLKPLEKIAAEIAAKNTKQEEKSVETTQAPVKTTKTSVETTEKPAVTTEKPAEAEQKSTTPANVEIPSQYPVPKAPEPLPDIIIEKPVEETQQQSDPDPVDVEELVIYEDEIIEDDDDIQHSFSFINESEIMDNIPNSNYPDPYEGDTETPMDVDKILPDRRPPEPIATSKVTLPTDEVGKTGNKEYIIADKLLDAIKMAKPTTTDANQFTKAGYESISFTRNSDRKYKVKFDPTYVRAIIITDGFGQALGYSDSLLLNDEVAENETSTASASSHLSLYVNNILRPLNYFYGGNVVNIPNAGAELAIIPITRQGKFIYGFFSTPVYLKLETTRFDVLSLEFKDFNGKPILCDNASGHIVLQFVKQKQH